MQKDPKHEVFVVVFLTQSKPVWGGPVIQKKLNLKDGSDILHFVGENPI